ncbi:Rossmann-fold NAD(P)-binding domain-containing protein [Nocardiopsis halotolerans]|uniref:NmrA family transcriptional regulator n=1 Tax=Nocardiopsis halotolerans TaxID=124252 RepID=UPI0003461B5D|nr:NmrA family transcriptional regulator [Nocardiopsis halotolerans]
MNTEHVLVTGGTGMTGRRVTRLLHERGTGARVGSRSGDPRFDWHDPDTWDPVLEGITSVYLCYHPDLGFPGAGATVAAFAARAARHGVRRAVLLSGRGEEGAERAERAVRAVFPDLTVLRCAVFAQNFSESFLLGPVLDGTVALPAPDVAEPFVDLDDVAEIAVRALTEDGHAGELYELTGPRAVTFSEAALLLGGAAGRPVVHQEVSPEEFVAGAVAAGLPEEVARGSADLLGEILDGRNVRPADGVERALGRPAADFAGYVRRAGATGVWSPSVARS